MAVATLIAKDVFGFWTTVRGRRRDGERASRSHVHRAVTIRMHNSV